MVNQNNTPPKKDRGVLTLFLILIFTLLVALVGYLASGLGILILDVLLIFVQGIVVKNVLDDYYAGQV